MAKQPYRVDSSYKQLEIQGSFSGGMNDQAHPEKLRDDQSALLENVNLVGGGVVEARGAYAQAHKPSTAISGNTQGKFQFENLAGGQDLVAINGQLYTVSGDTYTKIEIEGMTAGFQSVRPIEAVQYLNKMYIATGSGIVEYDGVKAKALEAYRPNGLEALYIGTNGYALEPLEYLSDTTGMANVILGVTTSERYGVVNEPIDVTAYVQKVTADVLEYKFETKNVVAVDYTLAKDWSESKSITVTFPAKGDYQIRVTLRKKGTTTELSQYVLPRFKVNTVPDEKPEPEVNFDDLKTCNRIFVHYDRLWIYGDQNNPENLYLSHLDKFNYFPRTNIINVNDPLRGRLNSVMQFRDFLVCFTDGSIQGIKGRNPQEFTKFPIHTALGTSHPYSVQIMKNYIAFVGNDNGIYYLKSFNFATSEDMTMNVERIDHDVQDVVGKLLKSSTRVLSTIYDNQYFLYIEGSEGNYIYRFYFEASRWVRDKVEIDFRTMNTERNIVTTTSLTGGTIYELDDTKYRDGVNTVYNMRIISKNFTFGLPHHRKKLKMYQLLAKISNLSTIDVSIFLDENLFDTIKLQYDPLQNSDAQKLKIMCSGRFRYVVTDIVIPVQEKVQLVGFGYVYKLNTPK